jgi:hypothetical protein
MDYESGGKEFASGRSQDVLTVEIESLLRRSVYIRSGNCGMSFPTDDLLTSLHMLTELIVNKRPPPPDLSDLLTREIALSREMNDREKLSSALTKMCRHMTGEAYTPALMAFAISCGGADAKKLLRDVLPMADEALQLRRGLGYGDDDTHIRFLTDLKNLKTKS